MRRLALLTSLVALCLAPSSATAKLPFMGLEVTPNRPRVGDQITVTLTCYEDADHTRARPSCFGDRGVMAWVHPLDDSGELDRTDWIPVLGHATLSGASRGRITLDEAGSYDVLPLWRTWWPEHSPGMPRVTRIEVGEAAGVIPVAAVAVGLVGASLAVAAWRRRTPRVSP